MSYCTWSCSLFLKKKLLCNCNINMMLIDSLVAHMSFFPRYDILTIQIFSICRRMAGCLFLNLEDGIKRPHLLPTIRWYFLKLELIESIWRQTWLTWDQTLKMKESSLMLIIIIIIIIIRMIRLWWVSILLNQSYRMIFLFQTGNYRMIVF